MSTVEIFQTNESNPGNICKRTAIKEIISQIIREIKFGAHKSLQRSKIQAENIIVF